GELGGALSDVVAGATGGSQSKEAQLFAAGAKGVEAMTLSDQRAKEIGESVAVAVINQPDMRLSTDDALNAYVTKVGLTVASVSDRTDINYTFGVLESAKPNALSMPGGYIFITRGALLSMQDESELAGVLAHEVGHICKQHGKNALKAVKGTEALVQAATADEELQQLRGVVDASVKELTKPFGQGEENSADAEAVKILKLAGYDPNGLARFLSRMSQKSSAGGINMSTHPVTADRITRITAAAGGTSGVTLKERFAANVKR
ncbi:MAG TPA: M48 family metalloprotease, partial [Tepidisphaeraceae bacterium]|nr:M48 family metalloprotease [Tepidisphaeraceae bacterium]